MADHTHTIELSAGHRALDRIAALLLHNSQPFQMVEPEIKRASENDPRIKLYALDDDRQFPARERRVGRSRLRGLNCCIECHLVHPEMLVSSRYLLASPHFRTLPCIRLKVSETGELRSGASTGSSPSALGIKDVRGPVAKLPSRDCAIHCMEAGLLDEFTVSAFRKGPIKPKNLPPQLSQQVIGGSNSENLVQRKNGVCHLDSSGSGCGNGATGPAPVSMSAPRQAKQTARVLLAECRARRHGHGFWFAFNAAQRARMRASTPSALPAPSRAPALPPQLELFV